MKAELFVFGLMCSVLAGLVPIYDKNGGKIGYFRDKGETVEFFDKDRSRKGYLKRKERRHEIYGKDWERKGYVVPTEKKDRGPGPR